MTTEAQKLSGENREWLIRAAVEGISRFFSLALRFDFSDHLRSQERVILAVL